MRPIRTRAPRPAASGHRPERGDPTGRRDAASSSARPVSPSARPPPPAASEPTGVSVAAALSSAGDTVKSPFASSITKSVWELPAANFCVTDCVWDPAFRSMEVEPALTVA